MNHFETGYYRTMKVAGLYERARKLAQDSGESRSDYLDRVLGRAESSGRTSGESRSGYLDRVTGRTKTPVKPKPVKERVNRPHTSFERAKQRARTNVKKVLPQTGSTTTSGGTDATTATAKVVNGKVQ